MAAATVDSLRDILTVLATPRRPILLPMIVYQATKTAFCHDAESGAIDQIILGKAKGASGIGVGSSKIRSWHHSLSHMSLVLNDPEIPEDTGVGIEYQIPQTSKRIDVLLSGRSAADRDGAVIVELKQWETADPTEMDGVVRTVEGVREWLRSHMDTA